MKARVQAKHRLAIRDAIDPGKPFTVAQVCMPIPEGIDLLDLMASPRIKGRKQHDEAVDWNQQRRKAARHAGP